MASLRQEMTRLKLENEKIYQTKRAVAATEKCSQRKLCKSDTMKTKGNIDEKYFET